MSDGSVGGPAPHAEELNVGLPSIQQPIDHEGRRGSGDLVVVRQLIQCLPALWHFVTKGSSNGSVCGQERRGFMQAHAIPLVSMWVRPFPVTCGVISSSTWPSDLGDDPASTM